MALITDPDDLAQASEITINTTLKTITLNIAGALSADGVTGQCLYSFLKEEWRTDNALIPFDFPMVAITPEQFEFVEDWEPANDASRKLLRLAGWAEVAVGGAVTERWCGINTLGSIDATSKTVGDKAYYSFSSAPAQTFFTYAGPVDEAIQFFGDGTHGNFDYTSDTLSLYIRIEAKTYGYAESVETTIQAKVIKLSSALDEQDDSDLVTQTDAWISTNLTTPFGIEFFATPQAQDIPSSGDQHNFGITVSGDGTALSTVLNLYMYSQYQLRQNSDIDDGTGTHLGTLTDAFCSIVGGVLTSLAVTNSEGGGTGVFIDSITATAINFVSYIDNLGTYYAYPYVAAGNLAFNANLVSDANAIYKMFFTTNPTGDFGESTAVVVDDNGGTDIAGSVTGATIAFTFDYDGNVQGGRSSGTDADVTVVGIGLSGAQHVIATGTIERTNANSVSLVAALERNYTNP